MLVSGAISVLLSPTKRFASSGTHQPCLLQHYPEPISKEAAKRGSCLTISLSRKGLGRTFSWPLTFPYRCYKAKTLNEEGAVDMQAKNLDCNPKCHSHDM